MRRGLPLIALGICALGAGLGRAATCTEWQGRQISSQQLTLPTHGARVTGAAEAKSETGAVYCKITGEIAPVDAKAPPILFEVNLPNNWNGKYLQYGGGGLNGTLITGTAPVRDVPPGPTPLSLGYVTAGTDGGHPAAKPAIQIFADNEEALTNHAYGAYKKTSDVARVIIHAFYGKPESKSYFIGSSEGGREALMFAQRYPTVFNGIVATVPVINWTGLQLMTYDLWQIEKAGGWMGQARLRLWQDTAAANCDEQDGARDGVIARYGTCRATSALQALRCAPGKEDDHCFTDPQLAFIARAESPRTYKFALANGERSYPGYVEGGEAQTGGVVPWLQDASAPVPGDKAWSHYVVGDVRYFITRDGDFSGPLDETAYKARILAVSRLMDMTNPDLSEFYRHGGKLILRSNTADYAQSPEAVMRYYEQIVARLGHTQVRRFVRFFVAPGLNHVGVGKRADGSAVPDHADLLTAIDTWVTRDVAPANLTLTSFDGTGHALASWPFCEYPGYPHYVRGDKTQAESYTCRPADRSAPLR